MTEEESVNGTSTSEDDSDVDYAFVVIKKGEGLIVQPTGNLPEVDSVDTVYAALCILKRNIEAQFFGQIMHQTMAHVAQQAHEQQTGQRASGLVMPK